MAVITACFQSGDNYKYIEQSQHKYSLTLIKKLSYKYWVLLGHYFCDSKFATLSDQ